MAVNKYNVVWLTDWLMLWLHHVHCSRSAAAIEWVASTLHLLSCYWLSRASWWRPATSSIRRYPTPSRSWRNYSQINAWLKTVPDTRHSTANRSNETTLKNRSGTRTTAGAEDDSASGVLYSTLYKRLKLFRCVCMCVETQPSFLKPEETELKIYTAVFTGARNKVIGWNMSRDVQ